MTRKWEKLESLTMHESNWHAEEVSQLKHFKKEIDRLEEHDEKSLYEAIYACARANEVEPKVLFKLVYRVLIDQEMGPRLAGFLLTIGKERLLALFAPYE